MLDLRRSLGLFFLAFAACGAPGATVDPGTHRIRYGEFMPELGRRFEVLGKAVKAQRYELSGYEAHEMQEVFDDDFPRAVQPKEVKNDLRPLGESFGTRFISPIVDAAASHDSERLNAAYAAAAAACNNCHVASGKGFIDVPVEPGVVVPRVDAEKTPEKAPEKTQ